MNYKTYRNCLRLQITVDDVSDERIDDLVAHCKKNGFDNVMLMLNTEEFNYGHITIEEARPWVEMFKGAAEKLRANGISVSLNNWIELGHLDRGRTLKPGQDFTNFTDLNGRQSTLVACPLCENWREYFMELVTYFVKELKPDTYWIEDDFRIHNHAPLTDIGCYCKNHMAAYNARLGKSYTREEFVKEIFAKGECNEARRAWLDINRETIVELADLITRTVKAANPETEIGLMSSSPDAHCWEARDWQGLLDAIAQGGNRIHRIHLPYGDISGKDWIYSFNLDAMGIRSLGKDGDVILPETEHGTASQYLKSARFLRFGLEASIPLVTSGMTYSIYDFVGNGVRDSFGFGQVIHDVRPYMQSVLDLKMKFSGLSGVIIPIDEKSCYYRSSQGSKYDIMPNEYQLAATVSAWGMSFAYSTEKSFVGKTLFMCESNMDTFSDDELKALFSNNYVFVDGTGVMALKDRGLLSLINAESAEMLGEDSGLFSYEESSDPSLRIDGVRRMRGSARAGVGPFVKVGYNGGVNVETVVKNQYMETFAPAVVSGDKFTVWPYCLNEKRPKQFCDQRRYEFLKLAAAHTDTYAICDIFGVSPYLFHEDKRNILVLINGNVDNFDNIPLHVGSLAFDTVTLLERDGSMREVEFERDGGAVNLHIPFEGLSSRVLILE